MTRGEVCDMMSIEQRVKNSGGGVDRSERDGRARQSQAVLDGLVDRYKTHSIAVGSYHVASPYIMSYRLGCLQVW